MVMTNYHVRFLGGKEAVTPLTYPVLQCLFAQRQKTGAKRKNIRNETKKEEAKNL
jgi:hypothetical protein